LREYVKHKVAYLAWGSGGFFVVGSEWRRWLKPLPCYSEVHPRGSSCC